MQKFAVKIENSNDICDYGCGETANYIFLNGKKCCSKNTNGCMTFRKKLSARNIGHFVSEETRNKIREKNKISMIGKMVGINHPNYGKPISIQHKEKLRNSTLKMHRENKRIFTSESKRKMRLKAIARLRINHDGLIFPNYNPKSIGIIKSYGRKFGYDFQHAQTKDRYGNLIGEFFIKELGYWVDAYDIKSNTVLEIDEYYHYSNGNLRDKDISRQNEIETYLGCTFLRLRISYSQLARL